MICFKILKDIREDNYLTQEDMAKILEVKRAAYSLWELEINIIPLVYLCKYADFFNISIDYILSRSDDKYVEIKKGFNLKVLGNNIKKLE